MGWLKKRFGERSTALGLGLAAGGLQAYMTGGTPAAIAFGLSALGAFLVPDARVDAAK
jgi:uncharacterized membrane protein YhfC